MKLKSYKFQATVILFICFFSYINKVKSEMNADNVLLAINCGGESFRDAKDILYLEDSYVNSGQSSDFGSQFEIKNTYDQKPYHTERWSESDFSYNIPVPEGKYVLVLKFSEVYFNSAGEKLFDVQIGNKKVVSQLDIYTKVGKSTAYDEFVEFEIRSGKAFVGGKLAEGGYDSQNETLKVTFKKGEKDNPKINGIVIVKGGLQDTDYESFKNQLEDLEKEKMEKERKQREIKKRNSLHYDFEEFEEDFVDPDVQQKRSGFTTFLFLICLVLSIFIFYSAVLKKKSITDKEISEFEDKKRN